MEQLDEIEERNYGIKDRILSMIQNQATLVEKSHSMKDCNAKAFENFAIFFIEKGKILPPWIDQKVFSQDVWRATSKIVDTEGEYLISSYYYVFDIRGLGR